MIYASLTDNELRLAIDNSPQGIAIRDEVVKRFLHSEDLETARERARDEGYAEGHAAGSEAGFAKAYDAYADK